MVTSRERRQITLWVCVWGYSEAISTAKVRVNSCMHTQRQTYTYPWLASYSIYTDLCNNFQVVFDSLFGSVTNVKLRMTDIHI